MTEAGEGILPRYNFCIVTEAARKGWQLGIVSQYTLVYCDQVREIGKAVLQYNHCTYDTAQAGALGAGRAGAQACGTRGAGARHGVRHSVQGCAHGAATRLGSPAMTRPDPPTTRPCAGSLGAACVAG